MRSLSDKELGILIGNRLRLLDSGWLGLIILLLHLRVLLLLLNAFLLNELLFVLLVLDGLRIDFLQFFELVFLLLHNA